MSTRDANVLFVYTQINFQRVFKMSVFGSYKYTCFESCRLLVNELILRCSLLCQPFIFITGKHDWRSKHKIAMMSYRKYEAVHLHTFRTVMRQQIWGQVIILIPSSSAHLIRTWTVIKNIEIHLGLRKLS